MIAQGKIFAAYALAYKLRIHDFFDWPQDVILIVYVVNSFLEEGNYRMAYTMAQAWGILSCWEWPLPVDSEPENGEGRGRNNGQLVAQ